MSDTKISALTAVSSVAGANEFAVNEAGTSKKASVTQLATFLYDSPALTTVPTAPTAGAGTNTTQLATTAFVQGEKASPAFTGTPTAPTAASYTNTTQLATTAFVQGGGPVRVFSLASDATVNGTTTGVEITGLRVSPLGAGTYVFQYFIRFQSAATTTGVKFGINHTGTAAVFAATCRYATTGATATSNAQTQASGGNTIHENSSTRTKSTTAPNLGPTASVDTQNADMLTVIEGYIIVTVSGDLALWHASEVAFNSTVMAGSSLILTKTG